MSSSPKPSPKPNNLGSAIALVNTMIGERLIAFGPDGTEHTKPFSPYTKAHLEAVLGKDMIHHLGIHSLKRQGWEPLIAYLEACCKAIREGHEALAKQPGTLVLNFPEEKP